MRRKQVLAVDRHPDAAHVGGAVAAHRDEVAERAGADQVLGAVGKGHRGSLAGARRGLAQPAIISCHPGYSGAGSACWEAAPTALLGAPWSDASRSRRTGHCDASLTLAGRPRTA